MNRHLVPVEVSVEGGTNQRMNLDGIALDQYWLKRLDSQAVQRRCPVKQDGTSLDHFLQHFPHLRPLLLNDTFGPLHIVGEVVLHQLLNDERPKQLKRHTFGQACLVQLEFRSNHDDRAA